MWMEEEVLCFLDSDDYSEHSDKPSTVAMDAKGKAVAEPSRRRPGRHHRRRNNNGGNTVGGFMAHARRE